MVLTVQDLGEQALLRRLHAFCPAGVVGDDAAVLALREPGLAITTDLLIDGVHFSVGLATPGVLTTSPMDAGWRAAAANLSDLAAMGAAPVAITVGLGLPGNLPVAWVEELYQGMVACLQVHQTPIVGGDVCRSPVFTIAITAFGQVNAEQAIRRDAAQVGDAIVVTGPHGGSRAGLELLLHPERITDLTEPERRDLIRAHQRPRPRLEIVPLLESLVARSGRPIAGMDSSDGLADAIVQICRASRVGATLDRNQIPMPPALKKLTTPALALEWSLYGGEDFELVLCLPPEAATWLIAHFGGQAAMIGTITETSTDVCLVDHTGQFEDETLSLDRGFQHF